ncbi:MAG: hypothetical protein SVS85_03390 [Candidatus Nanohaloarchaea archaeon]|nr:hypothetical protein [Candidatus Nanohaloarchaea archaeon]
MDEQPPMGGQGGQGGGGQGQMLQVLQQKLGNMELTLNALIGVLVDEDVIDEDELNEKAQEIVEEIQEQQQAAQNPEDLAEQLEEE